MNNYLSKLVFLVIPLIFISCNKKNVNSKHTAYGNMMVRMAEIEIEPEFMEDYLAILKVESEASVRLEPGVICIYPMYQQDHPNQIKLLEIYADKEAYESHLQTPHFKHYKKTTLHMVKSLQLLDMKAIDPETMPKIFLKLTR